VIAYRTICAAVLAALLSALPAAAAPPRKVAVARQDNVLVRDHPSPHAHIIAVLVQQTQVDVLKRANGWDRVRIWGSLSGWVRASQIVYRKLWDTTDHYQAPQIHYRVHASAAQPLAVRGVVTAPINVGTSLIRAGTIVPVSAWRQTASGIVQYRVNGSWVAGSAIRFITPNPSTLKINGVPIWKPVQGKGMWLTLGIAPSDPNSVAEAAARDGITHLYIESAISPLGFHGKGSVGPFIDAAHRYHIAVLAWVYPYLYDIASDVALTRQAAAFRSTTGQRFDGIAADLERNMSPAPIRAYSQLVRAELGPNYLLVGVTYPPQSLPTYPFSEVARQFNVIAPMDYWHQTRTAYGLDYNHMRYGYMYGYRYAQDSIARIRAAAGNAVISPIGQTFDDFGRLEMGPHAPSSAEVHGFLAGSKAAGAIGASFFQWLTTDWAEWQMIKSFRF